MQPTKLQLLLQETNLSNAEIRQAIGICPATLYLWKHGRKFPNRNKAAAVIRFFASKSIFIDFNDIYDTGDVLFDVPVRF